MDRTARRITPRRRVVLAGGVTLVLLAATAATPADANSRRGSAKSYSLTTAGGAVVRWDPCTPIRYRVNLQQAPAGALRDVHEAVRRVANATGITFTYGGTTTVVPRSTYGSGSGTPPPLVIAWAKPGTGAGRSDILNGISSSTVGVGGWRARSWTDADGHHPLRIVTGYVVLDATKNSRLVPGFVAGKPSRGPVLMHELAHAMGLRHVDDATQLMAPRSGNHATWGAGDFTGLTRVGRSAGCLP